MATANVRQRDSLERAYPPDAFASDAAQNGRVENGIVVGVRILSAPDAAGDFHLERASQNVGEVSSAPFLAPYRREERLVDVGQDSPATKSIEPDPRQGYAEFLAEIVAAAERFGFDPE